MLSYPDETTAVPTALEEVPAEWQVPEGFYPLQPNTLEEAGLPVTLAEDLVLKHLLALGTSTGRDLAEAIALPFKLMHPILAEMKNRMLVAHRTTAAFGDFCYVLTQSGKETAMLAKEYSAYCDAAPVPLSDYVDSVYAQSMRNELPRLSDLREAYADLVVSDDILNSIGPAINSGRGIFLFGEPGNGKTSIAERISRCFKRDLYIPRAIWVEGEIIQLFDPQSHVILPTDSDEKLDRRWVKIKRPSVVVGGELTMESLNIRYNATLKVCEAPLQMKANGGTFLIDDFGRQQVNHKDLLNRWIVPLEKRYDFLVLPNGKKIQVPFDELIIFSTNLNPADLVDDAFLRRIPYKIDIQSPDEATFRSVFRYQCERYGIAHDEAMVTYLIDTHYRNRRGFRVCHARDILDQILNMAAYRDMMPTLTTEMLDQACKNYFAAMDCAVA